MSKSSLDYSELSGLQLFLSYLQLQEKTRELENCFEIVKKRVEELSNK